MPFSALVVHDVVPGLGHVCTGSRRCPADSISVGGELARSERFAFTFLSGFIASYTQTDCVVDTELDLLTCQVQETVPEEAQPISESLLKRLGGGIDTDLGCRPVLVYSCRVQQGLVRSGKNSCRAQWIG